MRPTVIAGNWKMNFTYDEGNSFISTLNNNISSLDISNQKVYIFPPTPLLASGKERLKDSLIHIGAQNCYFKDSGAYTGELSAEMIKSCGADSVLIGHSERRALFNETNDDLNKKVNHAASKGLTVFYCIGESLEERENNQVETVIKKQLKEGLLNCAHHFKNNQIIIAYEPVWAIGTGKVATPKQAEDVHSFIRATLSDIFSEIIAQQTPLLYGGSVKPTNATDLLNQKNIDGALIGGACLETESFTSIIKSAITLS
jgi:triosephosphate isomerase (TIM)